MPDRRHIDHIDDFFRPGATLDDQLDDRALMRELDRQRRILVRRRQSREDRAYADACDEARELGLSGPTPEMVSSYVRMLERFELDDVPR